MRYKLPDEYEAGVISVVGQALVNDFSKMIHFGLKGNKKISKEIEKKLMPLIKLIFEENNPAGIKALLQNMGLCNDTVRLPLVPASEQLKKKIANTLLSL